jgi:threonylcarbamoyladenosine tRNA methylthiotransferase MtaB
VNRQMKVALLSLGCKVNQSELLSIESALKERGAEIVELSEKPDLCIINTCSVTARSDYQSRQLIRRAGGTGAKVIVTGCYSELNPEGVLKMKGVAQVIRNREKNSIISIFNGDPSSSPLISNIKRSRFLLKIEDGCNHSCSYCIIPKARGPVRSVPPGEMLKRVNEAVSLGYKEIVLTGIHMGLYGIDLTPRVPLIHLLNEIFEKTAIYRVRLSSLEINEVNEKLLEFMKTGRLCAHLHIPLQSGDDKVLSLMNRPYRVREFKEKVSFFSSRVSLGLGTDIIAGFPGEGETEFENTKALLKELPFTYAHVFPYSERSGTRASLLPGKVPVQIRKERAAALREIAAQKRDNFLKALVGREEDILIEETAPEGVLGTAGNYVKALMPFPETVSKGNIVRARFQGHRKGIALAKPVKKH